MIGLTHNEVAKLRPCPDHFKRVKKLFGGAKKWKVKVTAEQARTALGQLG